MTHLHKYKETTHIKDEDVIKCILEPTAESLFSLLPMELRKIVIYWTYVKFELQPLTFTKYNEFIDYLKLYPILIDSELSLIEIEFEINIDGYSTIWSDTTIILNKSIIFNANSSDYLMIDKTADGSMILSDSNVLISSLSIIPTAKNDSI